MNQLLTVYKPIGLTPYQIIQKVRKKFPEYKNVKIGFAGRLDPLAHGVLLLMIGNATKEREKYLGLPKIYEFEALFGVATDSYDVLGLLQNYSHVIPVKTEIQNFVQSKLGKQRQTYPPFSSKEVQGKPLYWWAKNNKLAEIIIPDREIEIFNFELISFDMIPLNEFKKLVEIHISLVTGHFRQTETLQKWNDFFASNTIQSFPTAKFRLTCSSGTYVRGLVHELGVKLGIGAITTEIFRTHVGDYSLKDAIRL